MYAPYLAKENTSLLSVPQEISTSHHKIFDRWESEGEKREIIIQIFPLESSTLCKNINLAAKSEVLFFDEYENYAGSC